MFLVCLAVSKPAIQSFLNTYNPPYPASIKLLNSSEPTEPIVEGTEDYSTSLHGAKVALPHITSERFIVAACDVVSDLPISEVVKGTGDLNFLLYEGSKVEATGASVERGNDKDVGWYFFSSSSRLD